MGEHMYHHQPAEHQLSPRFELSASHTLLTAESTGYDNIENEPSEIRCICGFIDDDGNTVLCEKCETWQHISCYYYPLDSLDLDFHHICRDCNPRELDAGAARQRQQRIRDPVTTEDRKPRRSAPKHKKTKTKENNAPVQTNGWAHHDKPDARGESPRDYGPPSKKPKTNHKHSASVTSNLATIPRLDGHRNSSLPLHSLRRLPPLSKLPPDYFSPDFIRIHRQNITCIPAQTNLHMDIGITNLLSELLDDKEAFSDATNGLSHDEVFKLLNEPLEELETPIMKNLRSDPSVRFHGEHPVWPYLTVSRDLVQGEMVGEIRGHIGRIDEYKTDASNKWDKLRHPDHFVFFHPALPIYIDCRSEGTILRYARRSCQPNLSFQTLITGEREYRFCLTATRDIPAGHEITVAWDKDEDLSEYFGPTGPSRPMSDAAKNKLHSRTEALLSHFGGCACESQNCLMVHFDRRIPETSPPAADTVIDETPRPTKNGRKRKAGKKSPQDAGRLMDSRASSEGVTHGATDDEMDDARSTSHSSRSKMSRDNTPLGPSNGVSKAPEVKSREQMKIEAQERLFKKMESTEEQSRGKKKRSSDSNTNGQVNGSGSSRGNVRRSKAVGSNPNTPASTTRPRMVDAGTSYFGMGQGHSSEGWSPSAATSGPRKPSRTSVRPLISPPPPPVYVDCSTQTEPPEEPPPEVTVSPRPPRSGRNRLLRKSAANRFRVSMAVSSPRQSPIRHAEHMNTDMSSDEVKESKPVVDDQDQDMFDANIPEAASTSLDVSRPIDNDGPNESGSAMDVDKTPQLTHPPIKPPPPPWAAISSEKKLESGHAEAKADYTTSQSPPLHTDLAPSPPSEPIMTTDTAMTEATDVAASNTMQSPLSTGPSSISSGHSLMPRPALDASVTKPSPIKKKMSLSDYMSKRKGETPILEKTQSQANSNDGANAEPFNQEETNDMPRSTA